AGYYDCCKNSVKSFSVSNSKGKGSYTQNDKEKNVLLPNINYYSRKEKKQILQNIHEQIVLKQNIDKEKILELYLNDKDVQKILKEQKIKEPEKKIKRIQEIVNNEENLNKKFNQFYDLFCFDLKNINDSNISINKKCNINYEIHDNIYDIRHTHNNCNYPFDKCVNNKNVYILNNELINNQMFMSYVKTYQYIKINLNTIKKFLLFIERNLINYDNTKKINHDKDQINQDNNAEVHKTIYYINISHAEFWDISETTTRHHSYVASTAKEG
ncbi:hypothetical protein PFDG_05410, partial [Plasmodium falciparum Dd2]